MFLFPFVFRFIIPRAGTETLTRTKGGENEKVFRFIIPRAGTETRAYFVNNNSVLFRFIIPRAGTETLISVYVHLFRKIQIHNSPSGDGNELKNQLALPCRIQIHNSPSGDGNKLSFT